MARDPTTVVSAGGFRRREALLTPRRIRTSVILIKIQIGLGILSMPSFLHTLGLIPGIIVIIGFGVLATWADYIVGQFKIAHPEVYTLAE